MPLLTFSKTTQTKPAVHFTDFAHILASPGRVMLNSCNIINHLLSILSASRKAPFPEEAELFTSNPSSHHHLFPNWCSATPENNSSLESDQRLSEQLNIITQNYTDLKPGAPGSVWAWEAEAVSLGCSGGHLRSHEGGKEMTPHCAAHHPRKGPWEVTAKDFWSPHVKINRQEGAASQYLLCPWLTMRVTLLPLKEWRSRREVLSWKTHNLLLIYAALTSLKRSICLWTEYKIFMIMS